MVSCKYISYLQKETSLMLSSKVIMAGNSQAVRIPKSMRLDCKEVWIEELADGSLLIRRKKSIPEGYPNIFDYLLKTAPEEPISGFTELCSLNDQADLPREIF